MKRLFSVWNQGFKVALFVADDQTEALNLAQKVGHLRRANSPRKFTDETNNATKEQLELMAQDRSGMICLVDGVWVFKD